MTSTGWPRRLRSARSSEVFNAVNAKALSVGVREHKGLFMEADGGTIFLDEIGDLPLHLQSKLLRVLQEKEVRSVGSTRRQSIDVRVISATHRDIEVELKAGKFREDLYYRINVLRFNFPAIASRREDIPMLAQHFLTALTQKYKKVVSGFSIEAVEALCKANWPGNVRQIFNVVEKCVVLATTPLIPISLVERALRERTKVGANEI